MVVLSTALLQIAQHVLILVHNTDQKKDILNTYRSLGNSLRNIKGQNTVNIIWEGRNQAVHFRGEIYSNVETVFDALINTGELQLAGYKIKENMSYEIVKLLGWSGENGCEKFLDDMKNLAI